MVLVLRLDPIFSDWLIVVCCTDYDYCLIRPQRNMREKRKQFMLVEMRKGYSLIFRIIDLHSFRGDKHFLWHEIMKEEKDLLVDSFIQSTITCGFLVRTIVANKTEKLEIYLYETAAWNERELSTMNRIGFEILSGDCVFISDVLDPCPSGNWVMEQMLLGNTAVVSSLLVNVDWPASECSFLSQHLLYSLGITYL